jgi:hypothetical protein
MDRRIALGALLAATACLGACDEATTPTASSSAATFTFNPNPAVAEPSTGVTYTIVGDSTHPDKTIA